LKVEKMAGKHQIRPDHPDVKIGSLLLMEAIGTDSFDFLDGLLAQLTNAGSQGREPDQRGINFMLSVVQGIGPQDEVEAMLATQMAAVHMATMTFARRLAHVESIPQQDSAERAFNKLARTFTAQVEALKRYRSGGQQKVTVEHVHVHAGGQAIVGSVEQGRKKGQPNANQFTDASQSPLWSQDKDGADVPISGDAERTVPDARRPVSGRATR
jgi:hypothetical protein